ncbi:MAG: 5'/3'-nucleotidase SurE [Candidatus Competibacteraceae bacterium]
MQILVMNDDGYQAPGLPSGNRTARTGRNRRGCSRSRPQWLPAILSEPQEPLYVARHENGFYSVEGTPTDCVHVAITGLLEQEPDMVISGINNGPNLGDDIIYSGTVAAAMEGRFLGLPAIAISQASFQPQHFATAACVAVWLVNRLWQRSLPSDTILNVNVPDRPWDQLAGFQVTRLGHRHKWESRSSKVPIHVADPSTGLAQSAPNNRRALAIDSAAVRAGYVSITPLCKSI